MCLRPGLQVDSIFVFTRQVAPVPACWLLRHQQQVDLWPFDLESGVRVMCDVGYLCANFSIPRPFCSRLRLDVRDRQTDVTPDVRQKHRLMPQPYGGRGIITTAVWRLPSVSHTRTMDLLANTGTDLQRRHTAGRIHSSQQLNHAHVAVLNCVYFSRVWLCLTLLIVAWNSLSWTQVRVEKDGVCVCVCYC